MQLIRRDVGYTIISRFEEAFRYYLAERCQGYFFTIEAGVPLGVIEKTNDRAGISKWESLEDFMEHTDFPDLTEITCFNNMYKTYFPDFEISQDEFQNLMAELYDLRCKIAHIRQYFTSIDLDLLIEISKKIAPHLGVHGNDFLDFLFEVGEHPEKVVLPTPIEFLSDNDPIQSNIPHNVPTPDYDFEGGFVGRDEDIKKVMSLLEGNLHRVITVSGAGGVGKTALALRIAQKYLRNSKKSFDGVVWLSAKETKLSTLGIEDVEPTVKSYEELLDTILSVMGYGVVDGSTEQKEQDIKTLFDLHNTILIVIDNLETIRDERIINFILDSHPKTKVLITSRTGLGQVERRHELLQLKEKEAVTLFRLIARDKKLNNLQSLHDDVIKTYVKKVACYPLAIKWVIGQVAIGKNINAVISSINETTSDISRFCFDQIFGALSNGSRKILCTLSMFDDAPASGVLNYVLNIPEASFEDSIRELILVSLVIPEQYKTEQNEISSKYALLSLTRGYVRQQLDKDPSLKREIIERIQTVQTVLEEAERAKKQYRFSLYNLGAITEEEKIAAMLATTAFQKYQSGHYLDAIEDYKSSIKIAPKFASIYRNWAVMEAQEGHSVEANELIKKAADLSPTDPQIWLIWGNIKRKEDKVKEALLKYEQAYKLSPNDSVVLNSLGQAKARLGDYQDADTLFREALNKEAAGDSLRHKIINLSSVADNLMRWAEGLESGRDFKASEAKLLEALEICNKLIALDKNDIKSQDILRHVQTKLGYFYRREKEDSKAVKFFESTIVKKPVRYMRYREAKDTITGAIQAAQIYLKLRNVEKAKSVLSSELKKIREPFRRNPKLQEDFNALWDELYSASPVNLIGKIIRVDTTRKFAIIESTTAPGSTYFGHLRNFEDSTIRINASLVGKRVSFVPVETKADSGLRKDAKAIRLLE